MSFFGRSIAALAGASLALAPHFAAADAAARQADPKALEEAHEASPVVVEMFLSQSCSSCVPAVKFMSGLAARDDVVALSWHVDYWNMLNTKHGRWVDPYSAAAYTARQKKYNMRIRSRSSVYTPQAVINGAWETVGSSDAKIEALIDKAATREDRTHVLAGLDDGRVSFDVSESEDGGNAYLVTFKKRASTDILRGENAGRTFDEINIVTGVRPLGVVLRRGGEFTAQPPGEDEGCALIVQAPRQARIIAAAYCPSSE